MHQHTGSFTIPDIRDFIPEKVKPWILFSFFIVFQLSGGVYMAAVSEMRGALSLMQEDIMMAGYASLVGLALTFTIMFRLKFRFSMRASLIITALGLVVCNLICIHIHSIPVMVITCFVAGIFKMWGTFTCNTNIQLWVTPKRDMSIWFCYIYLFVQGCIELSGLSAIYMAYRSTWEYMHWLIIGLLLCMVLITFITVRHYRSMPKLPLYGIDWMGMILWAAAVLCAIFVFNYGDHYDWYQSVYIWAGTVFGLVSLGLNLWRASFIRHPFIELKTWTFRNVWLTFGLYFVLDILLSPSHVFEHIYTEAILGYDTLNVISLNWVVLLGIVCGIYFMYQVFALRKWTYKTLTLIGFSLVVGYLLVMYFIIDFNLANEMLLLPIFIRSLGYIILATTFISALTTVPFKQFFQSLSIQAFMSACLGVLIGRSVLDHFFKITLKKNIMLLSANLDSLNPLVKQVSASELLSMLHLQAAMVSMKEIYGWLCIFGVFCLLLFFLKESTLRPKALHPKFQTIRRAVKHQLKIDKLVLDE